MQALLPLLLVGGVVGLVWHHPTASQVPEAAPPTAAQGLGGYLQGVMGLLNEDPQIAQQGLLGALSADPDNLSLRQRAMEAALAAGETAEALRLAKTLPEANLTAMTRLLRLTDAVARHDLNGARNSLRSLTASTPPLPVFGVLDAYLGVAEGHRLSTLVASVQVAHPGWGGQWHAARLQLSAGNTTAARTLLNTTVQANPGAYLAAAQLQPLLPAAEQTALQTNLTHANPALAPLLAPLADTTSATLAPTLADNTAAALLEFALQVWAEGVPTLAQQVLNTTTVLPVQEPLLQALLPYYRALLADSAGHTTKAAELFQTLAKRHDGFGALAKLRLNELQAQASTTPSDLRAAAAAGRTLADQYPTQPVFWQSALQLNLAAEDFTAATATASHLLALLPTEPSSTLPERQANLYFARGAAYAQAGKSALAETDLQQAITLNPAHAEALNYLGFLWVDENRNLQAAYTLLKRAHLLAPNNGAITDSVGWAYYRQGDYETAKGYLELAAQQEPGTPEILSHLGDTYFKLGQTAEARKLWQRALDFANQGADVPSPDFLRQLQRKVRQGQL